MWLGEGVARGCVARGCVARGCVARGGVLGAGLKTDLGKVSSWRGKDLNF